MATRARGDPMADGSETADLGRQNIMVRRYFLPALAALLIVTGGASRSAAQTGDASLFIRDLIYRGFAILQANANDAGGREAGLRRLMKETFDFPLIARFVLGKHWQELSDEQRGDYVQLFTEHALGIYTSKAVGFTGDVTVSVSEEAIDDRDVAVNALIQFPDEKLFPLAWRVRRYDHGYRVIDIMLAGVSIVRVHHSEFVSVIRNKGLAGFIDALRERVDERMATATAN